MNIKLSAHVGEREVIFELPVERLTQAQIYRKTIFTFIIGMFVSLLFIVVPILHFFIVPLGVLATIIFTIHTYRAKEFLGTGSFICPACGKTINIYRRALKLPFDDVCEGCHRRVVIKVANNND